MPRCLCAQLRGRWFGDMASNLGHLLAGNSVTTVHPLNYSGRQHLERKRCTARTCTEGTPVQGQMRKRWHTTQAHNTKRMAVTQTPSCTCDSCATVSSILKVVRETKTDQQDRLGEGSAKANTADAKLQSLKAFLRSLESTDLFVAPSHARSASGTQRASTQKPGARCCPARRCCLQACRHCTQGMRVRAHMCHQGGSGCRRCSNTSSAACSNETHSNTRHSMHVGQAVRCMLCYAALRYAAIAGCRAGRLQPTHECTKTNIPAVSSKC